MKDINSKEENDSLRLLFGLSLVHPFGNGGIEEGKEEMEEEELKPESLRNTNPHNDRINIESILLNTSSFDEENLAQDA